MELAFIRALKHNLSNQYHYIILADSGFGNERFIKLCESVGFDYLIRLEPNLKISHKGQIGIMSNLLNQNEKYKVEILAWKKTVILFRNQRQGQVWFIVTSLAEMNQQEGIERYTRRFCIEKFFQDLKSSGFDLEQTKIRKHARLLRQGSAQVKRLFFLCCLAYSFLLLLGDLIAEKYPDLKNSLAFTSPFTASSSWPDGLLPIRHDTPIASSVN